MHFQPMKNKQQILIERKNRIRARKRLYIASFVLIVFLISISIALVSSRSNAAVQGEEALCITVYPGDTLWSIASQYRGRTEIRRFIELIRSQNGLKDGHIYPGQVLELPQGK